jgi:hypothetical protein
MLAVLEFLDIVVIAVLIALLSSGKAIFSRRSGANAAAGERLRRIEDKLNLLLADRGIEYVPRTKERWQRLADSNDRTGAAREYHDSHEVSMEEAEDVVDQYLTDSSNPT